MEGMDDIRATFFEECAELLGNAAELLGQLADGSAGDDTLHAIFRAVHSIKGGAGAFGFTRLVEFTHVAETLMDSLRNGRSAPTEEIISLLVRAIDSLGDLVAAEQAGTQLPSNFGAEIVAAMTQAANDGADSPIGQSAGSRAPSAAGAIQSPRQCIIGFAPQPQVFRNGNEPILILTQLARLGEADIQPDLSRLPNLDALDPEDSYLVWTIHLTTIAPEAELREVFEFVEDDCRLTLADAPPPAIAPSPPPAALPAGDATVGPPQAPPDPPPAAARAEKPNQAPSPQTRSIRVDIEKVDRLVNLVGELVITQAVLLEQSSGLSVDQHPDLLRGIEGLSQHARELQESVMAIRAQPVKSVFSRIPRLVRDLAAELGRDVRIIMTGENTEIDKTVIEQLGDPLTHMIRNAIDHGIEPPAERMAAGKPAQGTIHLSAEHRSGRIVIEISDDGRGINRDQVRRKAESKGLIPANANLSDDEITNLIFLPGFSTAEKISNVSGRGVGMDVVKRNVQAMGGRINLESRFGTGSRFTLSLPLTLAILDGMVVAIGRQTYIIPLSNIVENLRPRAGDIRPLVGYGEVLALRGDYISLVPLHGIFGIPGAVTNPCNGIVVIVEGDGGKRLALLVDELIGQQQVVVKSIEENYGSVEGIGGATILGNGRVALILDVSRLRCARPPPAQAQAA